MLSRVRVAGFAGFVWQGQVLVRGEVVLAGVGMVRSPVGFGEVTTELPSVEGS